jgi:hypothetical protein
MPGKQNVYNIGELGIDVVESPVHVDDGVLLEAQNAQFSPTELEGAIRKRDGMAKFNSVAAAGQINAGFNVSLVDPAP